MTLTRPPAAVPPPPPPYRPTPTPPAPYVNPARTPDPEAATVGGGTLALVVTALLVVLALVVRSTAVFGLVIVAAIFIPLERLASLHPQKVLRRMWKTDLVHLLVNNVLATVGVLAVVAVPAVALRLALGTTVTGGVAAQPFWLQFVEAVLLTELVGYWAPGQPTCPCSGPNRPSPGTGSALDVRAPNPVPVQRPTALPRDRFQTRRRSPQTCPG